jgi:hypothetical protein
VTSAARPGADANGKDQPQNQNLHGLSPSSSVTTDGQSVSPLAALERFLLVMAFALYLGAVALEAAEHLYVQPQLAAIARLEVR